MKTNEVRRVRMGVMNVGNCNECIHCEEVMGDDAKCELNDVQVAAPIPDECIHFDEGGEQR